MLIEKVLQPEVYPHPVSDLQLIETHISWVILTGEYAYKIKKDLNLGFLDFSTLAARRLYCQEELRLNRRLAADIYLDVVAICQADNTYQICPVDTTDHPIVEYAVKMRQFDPASGFDHLLADGQLTHDLLDQLAESIARFHDSIPAAPTDTDYGKPRMLLQPALENFAQIRQQLPDPIQVAELADIEAWTRRIHRQLDDHFTQRRQDGYIRECHGDLHLRNISLWQGRIIIFDCIEFNPALRWIDVLSEFAFLFMDLEARGQGHFAWRCLNRYLQHTGDYAGLPILRFYLVYRAMVRAKVAAIELAQHTMAVAHQQEFQNYLQLARRYTVATLPRLIITHGFSGSGKTWLTGQLLEQLGAIRLRSDIERQRLFAPLQQQPDQVATGRYAASATEQTYGRLASLAGPLLQAGYTVILDATFLRHSHRQDMHDLAQDNQAGFLILSLTVSEDQLRQRIIQRQQAQSDASEAGLPVLEYQLRQHDPLQASEQMHTLCVANETGVDLEQLIRQIRQRFSDNR